ncbi:hypothetical protein KKD62_00870, partial [Patescibacteria group bacterium]|nr:hypothetical protein [Patescibacteria group bacterium]
INKKPKIKKVSPEELVKQLLSQQTTQVSDDQQISAWIEQEIKANPKAVADFKAGKPAAVTFLIGQVMRLSKGKAHALLTRKLILAKLQ